MVLFPNSATGPKFSSSIVRILLLFNGISSARFSNFFVLLISISQYKILFASHQTNINTFNLMKFNFWVFIRFSCEPHHWRFLVKLSNWRFRVWFMYGIQFSYLLPFRNKLLLGASQGRNQDNLLCISSRDVQSFFKLHSYFSLLKNKVNQLSRTLFFSLFYVC